MELSHLRLFFLFQSDCLKSLHPRKISLLSLLNPNVAVLFLKKAGQLVNKCFRCVYVVVSFVRTCFRMEGLLTFEEEVVVVFVSCVHLFLIYAQLIIDIN